MQSLRAVGCWTGLGKLNAATDPCRSLEKMIMIFRDFLATITEAERDFVSRLDYGQKHEEHRRALDRVIANGGVVDTASQGVWFPMEVLELGRNFLQPGHEREFVLCAGIVLQTGRTADEAEDMVVNHADEIRRLPEDLKLMLEAMITERMGNANQAMHQRPVLAP